MPNAYSARPPRTSNKVRDLHAHAHAVAELAKDIDGGTLALTVAATVGLADDVEALEGGLLAAAHEERERIRGALLAEADRLRPDCPDDVHALERVIAKVFGSIVR